jgi:hypothetical protein
MNWTASDARNSEDLNLIASATATASIRPIGYVVRLCA